MNNCLFILAKTVKSNETLLGILEPLLKPYLIIVIIIAIIVLRIAHYFALFRIRKEAIKMRKLLEDSPLNTNNNKKED